MTCTEHSLPLDMVFWDSNYVSSPDREWVEVMFQCPECGTVTTVNFYPEEDV